MTEKQKKQKKPWKTAFKKGQEVYLTAFLKEDKKTFYVCKGVVEEVPGPGQRQVYKVKITAVADRPIGGPPVVKQARLLGLNCTKRTRELHYQLSSWMCPPNWIDKDPEASNRYGKPKRKKPKNKKKNVQGGGHSRVPPKAGKDS